MSLSKNRAGHLLLSALNTRGGVQPRIHCWHDWDLALMHINIRGNHVCGIIVRYTFSTFTCAASFWCYFSFALAICVGAYCVMLPTKEEWEGQHGCIQSTAYASDTAEGLNTARPCALLVQYCTDPVVLPHACQEQWSLNTRQTRRGQKRPALTPPGERTGWKEEEWERETRVEEVERKETQKKRGEITGEIYTTMLS